MKLNIRTLILGTIIPALLSTLSLKSEELSEKILNGLLNSSLYERPFVSEFHSSISKVELGYNKSYAEYNLNSETEKFDRPMIELHLGFEAPLFSYDIFDDKNKKSWSIGATLPISVHVLEDIFEPVTAAVINTDFRFGSPRIKAIKYLNDEGFLKNISFSWIPMFHECTHLGDEIIIYRKDVDFPITRINVSYEYTEFHLTLNDVADSKKNEHTLRFGLLYRLSDRGYGYFDIQKQAIDIDTVTYVKHSEFRFEYFAAYQYQRTEGFLASERFRNILSAEFRSRVRYAYPIYKMDKGVWQPTEVKEGYIGNINLYFGWKFYAKSDNQSLGFYFHYFRGLNPYGQLRNYAGYNFFGLSLTYEP